MTRILLRNLSLMLLVGIASFFLDTVSADSLYQPASFKPLISDHKANKVGDTLTVLITESAVAKTRASTTTRKGGGASFRLSKTTGIRNQGGIQLNHNFDGGGQIEREGKLFAQMSVTIKEIYPNGDFRVEGVQEIAVNNEKQSIKLQGRVRPVDIAPNNTLLSTRVADARISYTGKGLLAKKQKPGLIFKILAWMLLL